VRGVAPIRSICPIYLIFSVLPTLLLGVAGCAGGSDAPKADAQQAVVAPTPVRALASGLSCSPWPNGAQPPADLGLRRSTDQDVSGTDTGSGVPAQVTVGLACVVHPPGQRVDGVYCGAADQGQTPRPCLVGQECAVGSIMVTEITSFQESDGVATCGVFENWSPTRARTIAIWAKMR